MRRPIAYPITPRGPCVSTALCSITHVLLCECSAFQLGGFSSRHHRHLDGQFEGVPSHGRRPPSWPS